MQSLLVNAESSTKSTASKAAGSDCGKAPFFQPKLKVNQPGDKYEHEADTVADKVMRMRDGEGPDAGQQTNKEEGNSDLHIQRKESTGQEFFNLSNAGSDAETRLQRQSEKEEEGVQRMEAENAPPELQLQPEPDREEENLLQTENNESEVQRLPASEPGTEPSMDTGASASQADAALDTGVAPAAAPLAPVLVVQPSLKVGAPGDKYEREADEMAEKVQRMPRKQWAFADSRLDGPTVQRFEEEEPPELQGKIVQLAPALQRDATGGLSATADFSSKLRSSGSGAPLPSPVRSNMESAFGADFSTVRIHTGSRAAELSSDIGARAFTHQNDIYFNSGQYNPGSQSGQFLLAHELTHTVQQGAAVRRQPVASAETPQVQAGFLDSIGSLMGDMRDRVVRFIRNLPGYFLISVIIGSDPITGQTVERTGMNFIRGFLLLLPGGEAKYNQLRDEGALQNAAAWMDRQMAVIGNYRNRFSDAYTRSRESLSGWDLLAPEAAFSRITGFFAPVVRDAIAYARELVIQVLTFLKDAMLSRLVAYVREQTRAYPLLQVLLGRDPITGEEVPQTMENILRGFLMLTEAGEAYYNKIVETGVLARATAWMREQIRELPTADEVINAFTRAWESFSFEDLLHPVQAFQRIYNILADPVGRIVRFVVNVAAEVLRLIKDALLSLLRQHAHEIRGYRLMTVLLNRDPVTGERVERNASNILSAFVELVAGPEQFQQIEQSGAIERMVSWLEGLVERTQITFQMVVDLFLGIWNSVTIQNLVNPIETFNRIVAKFQVPINRVLTFIIEVIKKVIEIVLQLMGIPPELIGNIINNAMAAIEDIKSDPVGFLLNLMNAVKEGFLQFLGNIGTHLLSGLQNWLFGTLSEAGIQIPSDLSLRSLLGMAMEVLGITVDNILERLALRIGEERVAQIRSVLDTLTGIWAFISDVIERGPIAIWEYVQEQLSNLWTIIQDGIMGFIQEKVIQQAIGWLMSFLDVTGIMPIIRGAQSVFNAISSFIEKLREILGIVNSFVAGVADIAKGNIRSAADFLELALADGIPVAIAFLARQLGLGNISEKMQEMIEAARVKINEGIDWLIDQALRAGTAFLGALGRGGDAASSDAQMTPVVDDIHQTENQYLNEGKITRDEAQIVANTVAPRHSNLVASITVVDGTSKWNYNYVQRSIIEGKPKQEDGGHQLPEGLNIGMFITYKSEFERTRHQRATDNPVFLNQFFSGKHNVYRILNVDEDLNRVNLVAEDGYVKAPQSIEQFSTDYQNGEIEVFNFSTTVPVMPVKPITFNIRSDYDVNEYRRQLRLQERSINAMAIHYWILNKERFDREYESLGLQGGRDSRDEEARRDYREEAREDFITTRKQRYIDEDSNMSKQDAENRASADAEDYISGAHATHGPDGIAGGHYRGLHGLGVGGINSSIGRQWSHGRSNELKHAVLDFMNSSAFNDATEQDKRESRMNVGLN